MSEQAVYSLGHGWMLVWTPISWAGGRYDATAGQVAIVPHPDYARRSDPYAMSVGCCWADHKTWPLDRQVAQLFIDFHTLVVRDGIDPQAAHKAFLQIDEYRRRISSDIEGALE